MGMFDNAQAPNPAGYPQGQQPSPNPAGNFGMDPRQALAMAMMQGQQNNHAPGGAAMNGIANGLNMWTMMQRPGMGSMGTNWNTPRMDPSQFAQPMNVGGGS